MHKVVVNRLGGLSLPRKSVVRLTDRPDLTLDVYRGRKTTMHATTAFLVLSVGEYTYVTFQLCFPDTENTDETWDSTEFLCVIL